ncbi:hypothetical protein L596_025869 [Steinernema carpocapsae]|uniref:Uncharacterized protein n=1 Tax=Steinernema carpocapsae TaxID=34508 RepID=A0A4V6XVS5_STECR|nr:hypothetical protein L596_025869 [Steinernema carpocapsae]
MLHPEVSLFVELKSTGQDSRLPQVIPGERLIMLEQMFDTGSRANVRRCYTILMFLDAHYSVPLLFHRVLGELGLLQQKPLYVKLISVLRREAFGTSENLAIAHILFQIVKPVLSSIYMTARTDKNDKFSDDEDMDESPPRIEEVKEEPLSEDEEPFIEDPEDEEDPAGHDAMFPVLRPILPLHLPGFGAPQPQFYAPGKQQPQFYAPPLVPKQEPGVQVSPRRKGVPPRGYQTSIWQCQLCRKFVKGDGNRRAHVITMHTTMPCTCPRTGCDMQLSNTYAIGHHLKVSLIRSKTYLSIIEGTRHHQVGPHRRGAGRDDAAEHGSYPSDRRTPEAVLPALRARRRRGDDPPQVRGSRVQDLPSLRRARTQCTGTTQPYSQRPRADVAEVLPERLRLQRQRMERVKEPPEEESHVLLPQHDAGRREELHPAAQTDGVAFHACREVLPTALGPADRRAGPSLECQL